MRSRESEIKGSSHPCTKWLDWNSEKGALSFWDKDKEQRSMLPVGFKILWLKENHKVGGYNGDKECGINSNEIQDLKSEILEVSFFDKSRTSIAKGLYKDIKPTVKESQGKYVKCLYGLTESKNIVCINLSGASLMEFMEFSKTLKNNDRMSKYMVFSGSETRKFIGRIDYTG